jgi:oxygen-independent coproporphyrinogen-3 oxidase
MRLDFASISHRLGVDVADYFSAELRSLADLENDGLVRCDDAALEVTETGRFFVRNIAMRFDAYATRTKGGHYSRTI